MNENPEYIALLISAGIKLEIYKDDVRLKEAYETVTTAIENNIGGVFLEDSVKELKQALGSTYEWF